MKRKLIKGIVLFVLVIPNTPIIGTEILKSIDGDHFRYSNANAAFTGIEYIDIFAPWMSKWTTYGFIYDTRPEMTNMEIFRLYRINPLCFWRWRYYLTVSRHFAYRDWEKIEPNRVPFEPSNRWQDF
ncbi:MULTISPECIES: hypothetical protein [Bacteroidota]|uniref:Uncharacterized protein n=2 Tax=Bacteroidota TaxID=976 RepID=A0A2X2JT45_SPHMU|nr:MULTISPECIES: hypothetical protein [Bacteroidota]AZB25157.1 hypothetical protein EG339_11495 [Chryseobacterium bernardetii]QRQ63251.1 hypothetical protein I6J33_09895 [Sphingobacterium multivorum]SPZ95091.1 Uncharacterised protein [Sphingobacterium multivorum]